MKTSIIGYPRIGQNRKLKFWTEDYFAGAMTQETLAENAAGLRKEQLRSLKNSGIDFIPSNDFSFYDNMLDTACLFGIIPERYKKLGLSELDTYFAMARGYQGERGDVKALPMKKWFNTNYHYIVPEFDDGTRINLAGAGPEQAYKEARAAGIETKPAVIGPLTLLKLSHYVGARGSDDFAAALAQAYGALFDELNKAGAAWIQIDEPVLTTDLTEADIALFARLYKDILSGKGTLKILLQTYFGDIRDVYQTAVCMDFDGLGLDFVEGKMTLPLIEKFGFPHNKLLFAGIVNGKNIWRNDYAKSLALISRLKKTVDAQHLVINTSCSLLHVPYTLADETALGQAEKAHFAFAKEKISELQALKILADDPAFAAKSIIS
jgi:5-methyltetrahydropteroyltriglutamate--homocysteine methyltransferase